MDGWMVLRIRSRTYVYVDHELCVVFSVLFDELLL